MSYRKKQNKNEPNQTNSEAAADAAAAEATAGSAEKADTADSANTAGSTDTAQAAVAAAATESAESAETTETAPAAAQSGQSPFAAITKTMWAFIALLIVIAGLGGYVLGERGNDTATNTASNTAAADDAVAPAAADEMAGLATPGTGPSRAVAPYDAQLYAGAGPVEKQEDIVNIPRRNPNDPFAIGAIDAPVVMSEFSDFECPFCSRFANQTEPTILQQYVDKGLLRMEWNDFPINGPHAEEAAKAGRAAAEQGKFIEFKHALYTASKDVNGHPGFDIDDFEKFAKEAGVPDLKKFRADATSDKYDDAINAARQWASSLGVSGTPGFIIGDTFVSGAQPTEAFQEAINQQLAKAAAKR